MKRTFFLFMIVALAFAAPVWATTLTHSPAQVEITVPDTWKSSQDGDTMTLTSPDEEMAVVFNVLEADQADKALETMDKELEKAIGEITWENDGKFSEESINGMTTYMWNGKAKGGAMSVDCLQIDTPSEKSLVVYWFGTADAEKKFDADIQTIVKGLKPLAKK